MQEQTRSRRDNEELYRHFLAAVGLRKEHLVFPVFASGKGSAIGAMPGMSLTGIDDITDHIESVVEKGYSSVIIFGVPKERDNDGTMAAHNEGIVQKAVKSIRANFGKRISITTDVCICQYNTTGHCGLVRNGRVDNDLTLDALAAIAQSHAEAGADVVAPSSMMDGQVRSIRERLGDCHLNADILSYSAKHASSLYAPFRSAAFAKSLRAIDKSSYQLSYANPRQAMREIETDIGEGADMVMIKPALAYLDLIVKAKDRFDIPVAAQNVSGEYAMIKSAGMKGLIDEEEWKVKTLASIRRAGADRIISYFALDVAEYL